MVRKKQSKKQLAIEEGKKRQKDENLLTSDPKDMTVSKYCPHCSKFVMVSQNERFCSCGKRLRNASEEKRE